MRIIFDVRTVSYGYSWGTKVELEVVKGRLRLTSVPGHIVETLLLKGLLERGDGPLPEYESVEFQDQAKNLLKVGFYRGRSGTPKGKLRGDLIEHHHIRLTIGTQRTGSVVFEDPIKRIEAKVLYPR